LHVRVKTAKRRKTSSTRWLERQLNDPYVKAAREQGYRSRAVFKLMDLDERYGLLRKGSRVAELGAAPGGWTQLAVDRVRAGKTGGGVVVAVDIQEMEPVPGAVVLQGDLCDLETERHIEAALDGKADVVLSDMAAPATGHKRTDHLRVIALCEAALDLAENILAPGGAFVAKVLKGGTERELLNRLKRVFEHVHHAKPQASRSDSSEEYVVATGFRGVHNDQAKDA
jgi:23S rRNA (uridine2552-2'-O)-methyltransferase